MAVSSYLSEIAGGMVVGAVFRDEAAASAAIDLLRSSGVRALDISVIASSATRAERIAGQRAWTPSRNASGPPILRAVLAPRLPREVGRYRDALTAGNVVLLVAADGQPPDTIAALFTQAAGDGVEQWWQPPAELFAPPELAGPF